ncbi:MAG: (2Fe-2S) ferredoxin domain-containing protein [Bacillota bacterium]
MSPIKSLDELKALRDKLKGNIDVREAGEAENNIKIIVGMATCGIAAGARDTMLAMLDEINRQEIKNVTVVQSGCMGSCYAEPTVEVRVPGQEPILYGNVNAEKGREIIGKHVKNGELVQNLIIGRPFETV